MTTVARTKAMELTAGLFVRLWIDRGRMPDEAVRELVILETERVVDEALRAQRDRYWIHRGDLRACVTHEDSHGQCINREHWHRVEPVDDGTLTLLRGVGLL